MKVVFDIVVDQDRTKRTPRPFWRRRLFLNRSRWMPIVHPFEEESDAVQGQQEE
jgi:hypothetical protein